MMGFSERIKLSSKERSSRIVLALDIRAQKREGLMKKALSVLEEVHPYMSAIKIGYHLLLPLSMMEVRRIIRLAHGYGLQTIADLKLNDIAPTNLVAANNLWEAGFDAVIANPIVGYEEGLGPVIEKAHAMGRGVILLVHMSHEGAKEGYELSLVDRVDGRRVKVHELFLKRALVWRADGVVVGGTYPSIVSKAAQVLKGKLLIFSPGIGVQGGEARKTVKAGADFLIIGRSIIDSKKPVQVAASLRDATWMV